MILLVSNKARLRFCIAFAAHLSGVDIVALQIAGGAALLNHIRFGQKCDPLLVGCGLAFMRNEPKLAAYLRNSWFRPGGCRGRRFVL